MSWITDAALMNCSGDESGALMVPSKNQKLYSTVTRTRGGGGPTGNNDILIVVLALSNFFPASQWSPISGCMVSRCLENFRILLRQMV